MKLFLPRNLTCALAAVAAACLLGTSTAHAAVLYNISSFNNDNTTASAHWVAGITTITTAAGLTGTDDAGLVTLQNLQADPATTTSGTRFRNTENTQNNVRQTVTSDPGNGSQYFQFGIAGGGGNIDLTSLTFQAVRATTSSATRGYNIDVSIDGGAYADLAAANVINQRNDGLQSFTLPITNTGVSSVDFRVYSTGGGVEYTNFAINGALVPEPSTAFLGGIGFLFLLRRRRN